MSKVDRINWLSEPMSKQEIDRRCKEADLLHEMACMYPNPERFARIFTHCMRVICEDY